MKRYCFALVVVLGGCWLLQGNAMATPGEYAFHLKAGPSFEVQDVSNSVKVGGDFDFEFGYGFGFNLSTHLGISEDVLFELIPAIKYDILYFIPGTLFVLAGAGYQVFDFDDQALGVRLGTGMRLPLKHSWEFITDLSIVITPSGVPGTPTTFDWLIGFGRRY